jgi:hypothetical protein
MTKFRAIFSKKIYAYIDVDAKSEADVREKELELFEKEWEFDEFNMPSEEWKLDSVKHIMR